MSIIDYYQYKTELFYGGKILHIQSENQRDISEPLLRFQEYYESPEFRGATFTLGEFRDWYSREMGEFSYYDDWEGFNLPDYVFKTFFQGWFDPLTYQERKILNIIEALQMTEPFYVIGTYSDNDYYKSLKEHELCHALYYLNNSYQKRVKEVIQNNYPKELTDWLSEDYNEIVFIDEINAYIASDDGYLKEQGVNVSNNLYKALRQEFRSLKPKIYSESRDLFE